MKLKSQIIAIGSLAALIASPVAMADKAAGGAAVCGEAHDGAENTHAEGECEVVEDEVTDEPEVTAEPGEPVVEKDPAGGEDRPVPVDWVKRGGEELENPDVIFYNTTADGGAESPVAAKGDIELGQDDKAAVIERKGAAAPLVKREKKGPVALVKKGRVFLR